MTIREIVVNGTRYRGPLGNNSPEWPWRITVFRRTGRMSTCGSGLPIGASWQTYGRYRSQEEALAILKRLEEDHA